MNYTDRLVELIENGQKTWDLLVIATQALKDIRKYYGQVCPEFEICQHEACHSSCGAWLTADETLHNMGVIDHGKEGWEPEEEEVG